MKTGICFVGGGIKGADYLIKIRIKDIHLLDKKKFDYLYNLGYIETKGKIKEIKAMP